MLYVAGWSLTNACNLACLHCYNNSGKIIDNELSLEECIVIADQLKAFGVKAVNFGGGECALSDKFIPLCEYLYKLNIKISYTMNGTTFDYIKDFLYLFHDVGVSIDFADEKKHDFFRGKKGTYRNAVKTIKKLVEKKVNTEIVTCITKMNCKHEELDKIYKLSKELKVNNWRLNRFRPNGRGRINLEKLVLNQEDLRSAYSYLSKIIPKDTNIPDPLFRAAYGGGFMQPGDPSGVSAFRIQSNGEVTPSVFLHATGGNIKHQSLQEIFDSKVFREIKNKNALGKCKTCPSYVHCKGGDIGVSFLEYGHFEGPDPLCWINPINNKNNSTLIDNSTWNVHELYLCTIYVPIKIESI